MMKFPISWYLKLLGVLVFFCLYPSIAFAAGPTNVGGIVSTDTTWTLVDSPYIVSSSILVSENASLSIEPGVEVRFQGPYRIHVNGSLMVSGTAQKRIVFTSDSSEPQPGDWLGIYFSQASAGAVFDVTHNYISGNTLQYTDVSYGGSVIAYTQSVYVSHSTLANNSATGGPPGGYQWDTCILTLYSSGETRIVGNEILNNAGCAIKIEAGTEAVIDRNIIYNNKQGGWAAAIGNLSSNPLISNNIIAGHQVGGGLAGFFTYGGDPTILHNTFAYNTSGMNWDHLVGSAFGTWSYNTRFNFNTVVGNESITTFNLHRIGANTVISNNNILNNIGPYDLYISDYATGQSPQPPIKATNNYWGEDIILDDVIARTYNYKDDFNQPYILIEPLLSAPVLEAPVIPPTGIDFGKDEEQPIVSWEPNSESNIAGYKVYYDTDPGYPYAHSIDVGVALSATLDNLEPGLYYIAVTAYNDLADNVDDWTDGDESWFSKELLADLAPPPTIQFGNASYASTEASDIVTAIVTLDHAVFQTVTVAYETQPGSATPENDYTPITGTLLFIPGVITQELQLPLLDDNFDEIDETISLILHSPTIGVLGAVISTTLTLIDDDSEPEVRLSEVNYLIEENAASANIAV